MPIQTREISATKGIQQVGRDPLKVIPFSILLKKKNKKKLDFTLVFYKISIFSENMKKRIFLKIIQNDHFFLLTGKYNLT